MMERGVGPLELQNHVSQENLVSTFDVENIQIDALMFQTGYLTIVGEEQRGGRKLYKLDYPNTEVRQSLSGSLLEQVTGRWVEMANLGEELCQLLVASDFNGFADCLRSLFAGIPHQWHDNADLVRYEAWYASLLYACLQTIGVNVRAEEASHRGRADMVLLHGGQVFVLELKLARDDEDSEAATSRAMAQIRERGYAGKYQRRGEPVRLVAVVFDRQARNVLAVKAELY